MEVPSNSNEFKDVDFDNSNDELDSPPIQNHIDKKALAQSLYDTDDNSNNNSDEDSPDETAVLLIDNEERLAVNSYADFIRQLKADDKDRQVKCVSIIGNTSVGKSYSLNNIFFNGKTVFKTSSASNSCTMGAWAALDEKQHTLVLDTEGLLGQTENSNSHKRLLLKIMCISDIIIYRTPPTRLTTDMFQFLSDASKAFKKYFQKELENVMKNCNINGSASLPGPTLVIFHEPQHTDILKDDLKTSRIPVQKLKERFDSMNLSYESYHSIEYVGVQTAHGAKTDFSSIKSTISSILENNNIRSPRPLSVIYKALKALNEKFNHKIPPEVPSSLPDEFFTCHFECLACKSRCTIAANHQKDNISHVCSKKCIYNPEFDNEVWKCTACNREGRDTTVYGKLIPRNSGLFQGLMQYVWSGFVIECPKHGEIYRSRKYWYGNSEPTDVTHSEIVHVWEGEQPNRQASDVTPRKCMEIVMSAGSYLSAPAKAVTEALADQVAPSYWVPNKDALICTLCQLEFGSDFSKHHCRSCGKVFCDTCSKTRRIVPWVDSESPVRVCNKCAEEPQIRPPPSIVSSSSNTLPSNSTTTAEIPTGRRFYDGFVGGLVRINANYPLELLKESTRPSYWKPDSECKECVICKTVFNTTTNRLHHCRSCGDGVCEKCSPRKRPVPERDWKEAVRVCTKCDEIMNDQASERK